MQIDILRSRIRLLDAETRGTCVFTNNYRVFTAHSADPFQLCQSFHVEQFVNTPWLFTFRNMFPVNVGILSHDVYARGKGVSYAESFSVGTLTGTRSPIGQTRVAINTQARIKWLHTPSRNMWWTHIPYTFDADWFQRRLVGTALTRVAIWAGTNLQPVVLSAQSTARLARHNAALGWLYVDDARIQNGFYSNKHRITRV